MSRRGTSRWPRTSEIFSRRSSRFRRVACRSSMADGVALASLMLPPPRVAAGSAELADHRPKHVAGPGVRQVRAGRQEEDAVVNAAAHGPIDVLEPHHEVRHFRGLFRLRQVVHPTDDEPVVDE